MHRYLRWTLGALLAFFVITYPADAGELGRRVASVTADGFVGAVQTVAALGVWFVGSPGLPILVGVGVISWLIDPRRVRRIVRRADLDPAHEGPLMAAYVGVIGTLTGAAIALLALLAN
jgi:hypothetical protein